MKLTLEILRQENPSAKPYWQTIPAEAEPDMTVATLLDQLNSRETKDIDGNPVGEIRWDCNCLQKKCGACAMVINGTPALACDTKLSELKKGRLKLEPLKKFPTVCDLVVDRSVMMENLKQIGVWLEETAAPSPKTEELSYEASRCLQCGCCLEVCPNFYVGGSFFSAAAVVPSSRVITELPGKKGYEILKTYQKNVYSGCGKSLSCSKVCPAEIDVQRLLVNSNAAAVWKRFFRK